MGNRARLTLCALPPGITLPEEDEEAIAQLEANNVLPLFWLALVAEADVCGAWEADTRRALAAPDGDEPMPQLVVGWDRAQAHLAAARARAPERAPDLAQLLDAWAEALLALGRTPAVDRVELDIGEISNFHEDADGFLGEVLDGVALWHGDGPPQYQRPLHNPALELGGYTSNGVPFPRGVPEWLPGRGPVLPPAPDPLWRRTWVSVPVGVLLVGAGAWLGGWTGAVVAVMCYAGFEAWAEFGR